jgi:hypothetical protein
MRSLVKPFAGIGALDVWRIAVDDTRLVLGGDIVGQCCVKLSAHILDSGGGRRWTYRRSVRTPRSLRRLCPCNARSAPGILSSGELRRTQ